MAENVKVEHVIDNNGRRVETRIYETVVDGQKERIVETHVEQVPMVLYERVVEKINPVVTTRKKETYKDGKVIDTLVEEHDTTKMTAIVPQSDTLTKEDLKEILRELLNARDNVREVKSVKKKAPVKAAAPEETEDEEVDPTPVTPVQPTNKVWEWVEMGAYVVLSGQLAFCLYHLVIKNWL